MYVCVCACVCACVCVCVCKLKLSHYGTVVALWNRMMFNAKSKLLNELELRCIYGMLYDTQIHTIFP